MNKKFIIALCAIGLVLIIFNATLVDFEAPLEGDSLIALIGITTALIAVILLLIYYTSKQVQEKIKEKEDSVV
jgi:membrane-bound ClpP family serine protease